MNDLYAYHIKEIYSFGQSTSQFILIPDNKILAYEAGQYVEVAHDDASFSFLSIACAPAQDKHLEFHLYHPHYNKTALDLLHIAQEKKVWRLRGPYGECTVSNLHPTHPIIFIAHNTGFASIKAVIEALLLSRTPIPIYFYWCLPNQSYLYLQDTLEEWQKQGVKCSTIFTDMFRDYDEANQYLLQKYILSEHQDFAHSQAYVSGPKSFVATILDTLKKKGLNETLFFSDLK